MNVRPVLKVDLIQTLLPSIPHGLAVVQILSTPDFVTIVAEPRSTRGTCPGLQHPVPQRSQPLRVLVWPPALAGSHGRAVYPRHAGRSGCAGYTPASGWRWAENAACWWDCG